MHFFASHQVHVASIQLNKFLTYFDQSSHWNIDTHPAYLPATVCSCPPISSAVSMQSIIFFFSLSLSHILFLRNSAGRNKVLQGGRLIIIWCVSQRSLFLCRRSQESKSHRIQTSTVFSRSKLFELWKLPGCQVEDRPVSCQVETRLMPTRRRSRQIQQACVERVNTSAKSARKPKQQEACRIQKTDQNGCHPGAISGYNPPNG